MTTSIVSTSATSSKLQVNNQDSFSFSSAGDITPASVNSGPLYGNRVINGAMEIDQVNGGAAVTPTGPNASVYLTDMFGANISQSSKLTFQQVVDAPAGLKNSLKVTVASQFSPAASDTFFVYTAIEGKDVIDFQLGLAGAQIFTTSHWIKGSVAGTYAVSIRNAASNRSYVGTVSVATSWAPLKVTVQGDVTGTWATDNTAGMFISFDLGSGSNFNTTAGSWQAGNFLRTSGSVTFVNQTAGSTLNITGVDCRLGSVAPTVFERRANELQLAQRYYETVEGICTTTSNTNNPTFGFTVEKRAAPTIGAPTFNTGSGATFTGVSTSPALGRKAIFQANNHSANAYFSIPISARLF